MWLCAANKLYMLNLSDSLLFWSAQLTLSKIACFSRVTEQVCNFVVLCCVIWPSLFNCVALNLAAEQNNKNLLHNNRIQDEIWTPNSPDKKAKKSMMGNRALAKMIYQGSLFTVSVKVLNSAPFYGYEGVERSRSIARHQVQMNCHLQALAVLPRGKDPLLIL
jgi:hypothetical protein